MNSHRLHAGLQQRFPWLRAATARRRFDYRLEGDQIAIPVHSNRGNV